MEGPGEPGEELLHPEESEIPEARPLDPQLVEAVEHIIVERFSGPLPHPEILARYEQILPGAADRILTMAEEQSAHRRAMDRRLVDTFNRLRLRGQGYALLIALAAIGSGTYLIATDKPIAGLATIIGSIAFLFGAFVYSQRSQRSGDEDEGQEDSHE